MIRLFLGILVVGLVSGCDTEGPTPAGVLSLDRNRGEAPAGVTIQDVDIIKDGFIDIKDLFAVVHFYEQEVPEGEADAVAEAPDADDESDPCRNVSAGLRFPRLDAVKDNSNYTQIFELEGKKYVYALLGLRKHWRNEGPYEAILASCVAVRFLLNDNFLPTRVKVKPAANNTFSEPLISPLLAVSEGRPVRARLKANRPEHINHYGYSSKYESSDKKISWIIGVAKDFDFNYTVSRSEGSTEGYFKDSSMLTAKWGIPIGNDGVIGSFSMQIQSGSYTGPRFWSVGAIRPNSVVRSDPFYGEYGEKGAKGVYVNMSPTEVRQRYFPEDL